MKSIHGGIAQTGRPYKLGMQYETNCCLVQVEGSWNAETVMTVLSHLDTESELLPPGFTADLAEAVAA